MLKFEINWNRKLALRGEATATAFHDTLHAFIHGNFACVEPRHLRGNIPTLAQLLALQPAPRPGDNALCGAYDDGTGRAAWAVWKEQ